MLVLRQTDVVDALDRRERDVIDAVAGAYRLHAHGHTALPYSVFLRFPDQPRDRIIGLPAYLGGAEPVAGMKWIASFPGNLEQGLARASAVMVLNSTSTGRPETLVEASVISARRTGAGAALAASLLAGEQPERAVALIGCGVINFEVLRFLLVSLPDLDTVTVYDVDAARAEAFADRCRTHWPAIAVKAAPTAEAALAAHTLTSIATTAQRPYLDLSACPPGALVLHVSLRDVLPDSILRSDNVVDDVDHVCREETSIHLASQQVGHRGFVSATIGELLIGGMPVRRVPDRVTVVSPFGLGVLDLAVARLVCAFAERDGRGVSIPDFLG